MSSWFDKAFILCVGNSLITSVLLWFGKLDAGSYATMVSLTTGAYVGAWVAKMIKGTPSERSDAAAAGGSQPVMQLSAAGYALIKSFEDCKLRAYPDPKTGGDPWTCGWGATGPGIERGTVWTQSQADQRLVADVAYREDLVRQAVKVPLSQGQFDALVSIVFNVGAGGPSKDGIIRLRNGQPSTLLRKLNSGEYTEAGQEFLKWVSPGSAVENGLRRRRMAKLGAVEREGLTMPGEWFEFAEEIFHAVLLVAAAGAVGLFVFEASEMILDLT